MPEVVAERLVSDSRFNVVEDPDNGDYVVDIPRFLERSGGRYEQIRRDTGVFRKRCCPTFVDLDLASRDCHEFIEVVSGQWLDCHLKDGSAPDDVTAESAAIRRSLDLHPNLGAVGLLIEGKPYGYTIYEVLGAGWAIGHFAKTASPLRGGTLVGMDAAFSRCFAAGAHLFNEEQDLGVAGLRRAKQSHRPVRFLRKYSVTLAQ